MTYQVRVTQGTEWWRLKTLVLESGFISDDAARLQLCRWMSSWRHTAKEPGPGFSKATVIAWRVSLGTVMATLDRYSDRTDCDHVVARPRQSFGASHRARHPYSCRHDCSGRRAWLSLEEFKENYPDLPVADIQRLIDSAPSHRIQQVL